MPYFLTTFSRYNCKFRFFPHFILLFICRFIFSYKTNGICATNIFLSLNFHKWIFAQRRTQFFQISLGSTVWLLAENRSHSFNPLCLSQSNNCVLISKMHRSSSPIRVHSPRLSFRSLPRARICSPPNHHRSHSPPHHHRSHSPHRVQVHVKKRHN